VNRGPHRGRTAGFTLLEVLVAFIIAALACAALYRAGVVGVGEDVTAARLQEALVRAQSHLAAVGPLTRLQAVTQSGDDGGGYQWRLTISSGPQVGALTLYSVLVTERFGDWQVSLDTKMLGPSS
jgi:general secretion pathway protein I